MNMASRTLRHSLGLLALLAAQWASAVGLGEIRLQSAMNEPLRAEIALLNLGDLNESQIVAGLAPQEDFQRAGIDREFQLADLRFKVDLTNSASPVIRVSSRQPMKEPYLDFLVELRWTSGRLLREYTMLLDLPLFAGTPPVGKPAAAAPSAAAGRRSSAPRVSEPARHTSAPVAARISVAANGSYRVQAGDTLWSIAVRNKPDGVTVQQAMLAIVAANPEAFIRANPNLIRRGALLDLPDATVMAAVDHRRAADQLRQSKPVSERAIESRTAVTEADSSIRSAGELRLAAGTDAANPSESKGVGGNQSSGASGASRTDIGAVLEEKDRVERENIELKARITSLEEQMKTASRLVEIGDPALAALQSDAQKMPDTAVIDAGTPAVAAVPDAAGPGMEAPVGQPIQPAGDAAVDPVIGQTTTGVSDGAAAAPGGDVVTEVVGEVSGAASETSPGDAVPQTAVVPAPADEGPLTVAARLRPWLVPALGLTGVLLLVAMGFIALRGRATQQHGLQLPGEFEAKGDRPAAFDSVRTAPVVLDDEDLLPAAPAYSEGPDQILEEVDVCLSFGNEQQARELLTGALGRYPGHSGLHLKMLELLAQQGDISGFEAALPKLTVLADRNANDSANALLRELQERDAVPVEVRSFQAEPLQTEAVQAAQATVADNLGFDLDLDLNLDLPVEPTALAATTAAKPETPDDLEDFDLGLMEGDRTTLEDSVAEVQAAETMESWQTASLDSDLDLFEPGQEMATQIELAEAYVDMGDAEGAREILDYVLQGGDEEQKEFARQLLARLG
jgi:pilus assembly protein FimV